MKINKYFILVVFILGLTSCNKWLTVSPKGQADESELLTTVYGYNTALGGVYYTLSSSSMFGKEMSYGFMDVLANYWNVTNPAHSYYNATKFDYSNLNVKGRINTIWKSYYSCIAQCNSVLAGLEKNRATISNSELFEGEALALRAFCHMELLKYFGPVIRNSSDLDKKAIAYRKVFDVIALEFNTCREVLEMAEIDFKKALELMKNDPITVLGRKGDANVSLLAYNNILSYRGVRMNYYAVLAMMARLEQLRLNQNGAYTYAMRLITETKESEVLGLINKSIIDTPNDVGRDLNYSSEMVFGILVANLWDLTNSTFGMSGNGINENSSLVIDSKVLYPQLRTSLYERAPDGSAFDNRLRYWFTNDVTPDRYEIRKLRKPTEVVNMGAPAFREEIGVFRMSEAYYIASEALIGKNNTEALELLNTVRRTRNLTDIEGPVNSELLMDYLVREQRKDFIGDGRMFALYKRLFIPIYISENLSINPIESNFVWPIPDEEYEFSPNQKPKV